MQTLPTNSTAILTRQEDKIGCNLRWLNRPPNRRLAEGVLRLRVHGAGDQGRPDRARAHLIAADPFTDELVR